MTYQLPNLEKHGKIRYAAIQSFRRLKAPNKKAAFNQFVLVLNKDPGVPNRLAAIDALLDIRDSTNEKKIYNIIWDHRFDNPPEFRAKVEEALKTLKDAEN